MENGPFEDVFPIETWGYSCNHYLSLPEGNCFISFCNTKNADTDDLFQDFLAVGPTPFDARQSSLEALWGNGWRLGQGTHLFLRNSAVGGLQQIYVYIYLYIYIYMYLWYVWYLCKNIYINTIYICIFDIYIYMRVCVCVFLRGGCNYFDVCVFGNKHDDNSNFDYCSLLLKLSWKH